MSDVLIHQQSFDYALSRTVSTLIDWFPAGPLSAPHNNNNITAPSAPLIPSSKVPVLENPSRGPPRRSSSSMELPLAPKMGTVTPRGTSTTSAAAASSSPATTRAGGGGGGNAYVRGMSGSGTPPIGGSFGGESSMSFHGSDTAVGVASTHNADSTLPSVSKAGGGGGGLGSYFKWGGRGGNALDTPPTSAFSPSSSPLLPSLHFHSLISSLATATIYDSTASPPPTPPHGGDHETTSAAAPISTPPSRFFNNGGFVVRAGVFTGLRLYASDSGGAIKMFSSLINRCSGNGSGGIVSPLDIGAAPVIQLRASVRSKDSVNAAGIRLTLQDSGFSSLDFLVTAGRPKREQASSSQHTPRPIPFYTHLCRFDKFLVTNYGMFNLYEASAAKSRTVVNGEVQSTSSKPPVLRRLRAGFGLVVRTEKNGLNILWGFCAELFKSLIVAFHADVIRRWCISCCSANTLGIKGLEVGLRLRINLISYQNTMLDVGIKQCIPLIIPSNCRRSNKKSVTSSTSTSLYRLGSWNWRAACNSYGVAVGGSLDDTDVADLIRAVADVVGGGDEGSRTLTSLGTSLLRPVPHRLRRSAKAAMAPVTEHLSIPEEGRLRKVIDGTCHVAGLGYYIGVAVPLYCTAITTALSISGGAALYRQLAATTKSGGGGGEDTECTSPTTLHPHHNNGGGSGEEARGDEFPSLGAKLSTRPMAFWEVRRAVGEAVREAHWVSVLEGSRVDVTCGVTTRLSLPSIMEYVGLTAPDLSNGLVNYFNNYSAGGSTGTGSSGGSVASSPSGGGTRAPSKPPLSPRTATHNQQQGGGNAAAPASQNRPAIRGLNCFISITFS